MKQKHLKVFLVLRAYLILASCTPIVICQDFGKYFELKAEKYSEAEEEYVGIAPMVMEKASDPVGRFIVGHRRRFAYLLANRTEFQRLDSHYPDTKKINRLYLAGISRNQKFKLYFNQLTGPARTPQPAKDLVTEEEIMKVASKFFFCSAVRKDNSINPYICVSLNGVKEAAFTEDYTVLEAICFEAIFEMIDKAAPKRAEVVENFLRYVEEVSTAEKQRLPDTNAYLLAVRSGVFQKMETDPSLRTALLDFFKRNEANIPFKLIK